MDTYQQNRLTMLQTVLRYLADEGKKLTMIKRIGIAAGDLKTLVDAIGKTTGKQGTPTTGVTRSREEVKVEATMKAEVLRLLAVTLTTDPTLRAALKQPVSKVERGKDEEYVTYLGDIAAAIGTLKASDLNDAGYDPAVLATLTADVASLTTTQGAARQIQLGTSTATAQLPELFGQVDALLTDTLDPLVGAQKLSLPTEVAEYEQARRIVHTAARRRPRYAGTVGAGAVVLVYDRRVAGVPDPTLANRSGKGVALRFYTADSATARPAAGQGLVLKAKAEAHLESYAKLGDEDAPFLLVVLEGVDGEGHWGVK